MKPASVSELDLRTAEGQMQTARSAVAGYEQQLAQAENYLVLLVGRPLPEDLSPPQPFDPQICLSDLPAGLPSDLLQRRPDILAAEHQLKAANANIGAARAAFFPTITLTGSGRHRQHDARRVVRPRLAGLEFFTANRMAHFRGGDGLGRTEGHQGRQAHRGRQLRKSHSNRLPGSRRLPGGAGHGRSAT